jgi:hypothetical protein
MRAVDVNVLVSAFRADSADHPAMREWLERAVASAEGLAVSDAVMTGTLRILTNPRVFAEPTPNDRAISQLSGLREQPRVVRLVPGPRHWALVTDLCLASNARGNLVADAAHAAMAIEHGAVWISKDRDFARFPGLRWRHPLDDVGPTDAQ